jgi:hypothetical protein
MRITIDTNLINAKGREPSMIVIERWQAEGKLVLVGANRLLRETGSYTPAAYAKARAMPNVGEPLVWDAGGGLDDGAYFDGPAEPTCEQLAEVLFRSPAARLNKNQMNDVMHLLGHVGGGCGVFLTNDANDFVRDGRRETLKSRWGITVKTPAEYVEEMVVQHGWSR